MLSFEEFSFPVRCFSKPENWVKQSIKRWWKEEFLDVAVKETYIYFKYLDQPITEKSCSLTFLEIQSIRRPESGTPTKHQSSKIYLKLSQIEWSEVLHLVKIKSLEDPHFLFGFKGRELQLSAFLSTLSHQQGGDSWWLPCPRLGTMMGNRGSASVPLLHT